jgi:hypothetical protein
MILNPETYRAGKLLAAVSRRIHAVIEPVHWERRPGEAAD